MKNERSVKVAAIVALCFAILGISISFAVLSSTLEIKGVATIKEENWDVHFDNLNRQGSSGVVQNIAPTLNATYIGDFDITLGGFDYMTYTFDVVNAGSLNAKIGTINYGVLNCTGSASDLTDKANDEALVCGNIIYQLTYANDTQLQLGDTLLIGETKSLKLKIAYNGNTLPTKSVRVTGLDISFIYVQD